MLPSPYPLKAKYRERKPHFKGKTGSDGTRDLPRRKRRTPKHQKGVSYPGQWVKR